ncbi:MAG: hypothetical protein PHC75_07040, partial [Burkholderiales bacterium]|nr:hypothetical protein [Burkholderiales bacterium]
MKRSLKNLLRNIGRKQFISGLKRIRHTELVHQSFNKTIFILFGNRVFAGIVVIPTLLYFLYSLLIYT